MNERHENARHSAVPGYAERERVIPPEQALAGQSSSCITLLCSHPLTQALAPGHMCPMGTGVAMGQVWVHLRGSPGQWRGQCALTEN